MAGVNENQVHVCHMSESSPDMLRMLQLLQLSPGISIINLHNWKHHQRPETVLQPGGSLHTFIMIMTPPFTPCWYLQGCTQQANGSSPHWILFIFILSLSSMIYKYLTWSLLEHFYSSTVTWNRGDLLNLILFLYFKPQSEEFTVACHNLASVI